MMEGFVVVFSKWRKTIVEFRESDKSLKHELGSILKILSLTYPDVTVVASWSLTQEVAGSSRFNDFVTEFVEFSYQNPVIINERLEACKLPLKY